MNFNYIDYIEKSDLFLSLAGFYVKLCLLIFRERKIGADACL